MRLSRLVVPLAVALSALAVAGAGTGAETSIAPQLELDGKPFRPELALTTEARARGLMGRRPAPRDGMLFVFPGPTTGGFWMKNTLVPLRIVFFNRHGRRVRELTMTPCTQAPCRVYYPGRTYRYALELRASDRRPAAVLGPLSELHMLSRLSR